MRQAANNIRSSPTPRQRGVALLIVILLLSMTFALSYAAMRSQYTATLIHRNFDCRQSARQAARTGIAVALRKMHTTDWEGVDTTLTGRLSDVESFEVTFTTGDPTLQPGDPDYEDFPYRVTLLSTGKAADPGRPDTVAQSQVRAVVRLIPRALGETTKPSMWSFEESDGTPGIFSHTVYSWHHGWFDVDVPARIEGRVRMNIDLYLGMFYPWTWSAHDRYLEDLNKMRLAGKPDWRPFNGPVAFPFDEQITRVRELMADEMGIPLEDVRHKHVSGWDHPGDLLTYQLYPGGKTYSVEVLAQNQTNATLEPDAETNPLGIFYRVGTLLLYDNVSIRGTVITRNSSGGDIHVYGKNVQLQPYTGLPALYDPTVESPPPIQLPIAIVEDDMRIHPDASGSIQGMLAIWDQFEIQSDNYGDIDMPIEGCIVTNYFMIKPRSDWVQTSDWWNTAYADFLTNYEDGMYFPEWLADNRGLDPEPRLTIKPSDDPIRYLWKNPDDPVYVPHADDEGLRWELLQWTENP